MPHKKELDDTRTRLKRISKDEDYSSMRRGARNGKNDFKRNYVETGPVSSNSYRHAGEIVTQYLTQSDYHARKGEYSAALGLLHKAYDQARNFPEVMKDKYTDAIERRAVRMSNRVDHQRPDMDKPQNPENFHFNISNFLDDIENERGSKRKLEEVAGAVTVVSLLGSIFFLSLNLTGNAIGSGIVSNFIGVGLFLLGLAGSLFYFRNKILP